MKNRQRILETTVVAVLLVAAGCSRESGKVRIRVESSPSGAIVFLDSSRVGETPVSIERVSKGPHSLALMADGYAWTRRRIVVARDGQTFKFRLAREPRATLIVETEPQRADVTVDGVYQGRTPVVVSDLEPGDHEVLLDKVGFVPIREIVPIAGAGATRLHRTLQSKIEKYYVDAIQKKPFSLHNYTELLHHQVIEGEYDAAQKTLTKALDVIGKRKNVTSDEKRRFYQELRKIHQAQFEYGGVRNIACMRKAIENALLQAVQKYPSVPDNAEMLAQILRRGRNLTQQVRNLEEIAKEAPENLEIQKLRAEAYRQARQYSKALKVLQQVVQRAPQDAAARISLARVASMMGRRDLARDQMEKLLRVKDLDAHQKFRVRMMLAHIYRKSGEFDKAIEQYQLLLKEEKRPDVKNMLLYGLAGLYVKTGRDDKAREIYTQILNEFQKRASRWGGKRKNFLQMRIEARLNGLMKGEKPPAVRRDHAPFHRDHNPFEPRPMLINAQENLNR